MSSIFGGSKSKQTSSNQAFGQIKDWATPLLGYAQQGATGISDFLGGNTTGFDAYKRATGFDAAAEAGSRGITGNAAASGLLRSGGTAKALQAFGNQMQNQYADKYMDNLFNQANLGYNAAQILGGAGTTSTSKSKSKNGIGGFLGSVAGGLAASDARLKKNIFKIGEMDNGLGIYQYRYIDDRGPFVGVMAQEVAQKVPDALGPTVDGYLTVDYNKLGLTGSITKES